MATLTVTTTHHIPGGPPAVETWSHQTWPHGPADTYEGTLRRLREAGRDHTHGPGWITYESDHHAQRVAWTSTTRMEWT